MAHGFNRERSLPMSQLELVIFDFDGVLVDSEILASRIEAELITQAGYEISPEELAELYAGLTFKDILLRIEEMAAIPFKASLIDQAEELVDRRVRTEARMIEGAREAVAAVAGKRCICSNSPEHRVRFTAERTGLASYFAEQIFCAPDIPSGKPKPAPDVFLYASQKLGADPARTFVVEDSVHGIAGAKGAGMRVIGFTGGSHTYPGHADVLTEAGAETVIRRWADFASVLAALSEWSADSQLP